MTKREAGTVACGVVVIAASIWGDVMHQRIVPLIVAVLAWVGFMVLLTGTLE